MKKKILVMFLLVALLAPVFAGGQKEKKVKVGISMALFADNFLTYLREAMEDYADGVEDLEVFSEDAKGDVGRQLGQVENFIAQGYDAIIVNPADTEATSQITKKCQEAGIPIVYVNRAPEDGLPEGTYYVGSDEVVAGREQAKVLADKMGGKGNVVIMLGELAHSGTKGRTKGVKEILSGYPDIKIIAEQTALFQRDKGLDLMSNWLLAGLEIDAVASNNDEMAIGAIMALKNSGKVPNKDVFVGGVDATPDALDFIEKGELTVSVFQNAKGQGRGAIDVAYKVVKGEAVEKETWIPFEPVTAENYKDYK